MKLDQRLNLRVPTALRDSLAVRANAAGMSLSAYVVSLLGEQRAQGGEQAPTWKVNTAKVADQRLTALEARVAALEADRGDPPQVGASWATAPALVDRPDIVDEEVPQRFHYDDDGIERNNSWVERPEQQVPEDHGDPFGEVP